MTKAELAIKIQSGILDITEKKGVTREKIAELFTDVANLATPNVTSGGATEIFQIDGKPVFKKLFFIPKGEDLESTPVGIPEDHSLIEASCLGEIKKNENIQAYINVSNGNLDIGGIRVTHEYPGDYGEFTTAEFKLKMTFPDGSTEILEFANMTTQQANKDVSIFGEDFEIDLEVFDAVFDYNGTAISPTFSKLTGTTNREQIIGVSNNYNENAYIINGFGQGEEMPNDLKPLYGWDLRMVKNIVISLTYLPTS